MLNFSLKTLKGWLLKRKKRKMVTYVAVRNVCVVVEKLKTGHMSPKNVNKHNTMQQWTQHNAKTLVYRYLRLLLKWSKIQKIPIGHFGLDWIVGVSEPRFPLNPTIVTTFWFSTIFHHHSVVKRILITTKKLVVVKILHYNRICTSHYKNAVNYIVTFLPFKNVY